MFFFLLKKYKVCFFKEIKAHVKIYSKYSIDKQQQEQQ
jgi:hypothetical protein